MQHLQTTHHLKHQNFQYPKKLDHPHPQNVLEFALFLFQLCINNKILVKHFFDWTIMGGATIIPHSPRTTQNEKKFSR